MGVNGTALDDMMAVALAKRRLGPDLTSLAGYAHDLARIV